jgi:hypothetical protein
MIEQALPWDGMFTPPKIKITGACRPQEVDETELEAAREKRLRRIEMRIVEIMRDGQIRSAEEISQCIGIALLYTTPLLTHLLMMGCLRRVSGYRQRWIIA